MSLIVRIVCFFVKYICARIVLMSIKIIYLQFHKHHVFHIRNLVFVNLRFETFNQVLECRKVCYRFCMIFPSLCSKKVYMQPSVSDTVCGPLLRLEWALLPENITICSTGIETSPFFGMKIVVCVQTPNNADKKSWFHALLELLGLSAWRFASECV
jgi:hypothetical protein